ncbi:hypothetical protein F8G92_20295 [Salmonella enterica subsp. enterica serovar Reading]|nr:hypothetical protein [Salmonella enterica subsp. enterica serovar Eko]EBK5512911.1 hypothetical protein [Salmonella enterica]EDP0600508.1 hypothetical protein [Salmonella enterica subsp. enterica serovar Reading]EED8141977.1 hypothetical protein [Salmonella enterica subsp. enterica]EDP1179963.1 hypothetical protein [Salmonella enterica subsp. enterica serovar Reading]
MKKHALGIILTALAFSVHAQSVEQIESSAKIAVKNEVMKRYKPGDCDRWKALEQSGQAKVGSALANCDSSFNPAYDLTFSDVKVFQHKNYNAVCGVVSGRTDVSKIGGRFVYTDGDSGHVFVKNSKYPALLMSKNIDMMALLDKQLKLESVNCK